MYDCTQFAVISLETWLTFFVVVVLFRCRNHDSLLGEVSEGMADIPGLFLLGNYKSGVSIGDCITSGASLANEVTEYLNVHR